MLNILNVIKPSLRLEEKTAMRDRHRGKVPMPSTPPQEITPEEILFL